MGYYLLSQGELSAPYSLRSRQADPDDGVKNKMG